jgi:formamidopyrimidine-DNA glycosylase
VSAVNSYGKKILIHVGTKVIIVSLGMTGRLQYQAGAHSHISFQIADVVSQGVLRVLKPVFTVYFEDPRYMGNLNIIDATYLPTYLEELGPDVLERALKHETWIPLEEWIGRFQPSKYPKRAICDVLMRQNLVAGIGNYLKSEILYYARVLPDRAIGTLTTEEWDRIRLRAHEVVRLSYSHGGFTIESFISPDGATGNYPAVVYGKRFDPQGNPVVTGTTRDKRTSHWVPAVQQ